MSADGNGYVGRSMKRKEDPRMITGEARYVDDITLPGMLHAAIVRSSEAHAAIVSIDVSGVEAREDVVAVFTGEDLAESFKGGLPMVWDPPGVEINTPDHWPLKRGEVKHVGDPVAVVVGTDRYSVVDAAEQVVVDYDPKPAVVDPEKALEDGSPLVWEQFGTNRTHEWGLSGGDIEAGLAEADAHGDCVLNMLILNKSVWDSGYWALAVFTVGGWAWLLGALGAAWLTRRAPRR